MTSRERVLTSLNFQQPDHVPIDFGGHRSSGIMALAYKKLKEALGIESGDIYVYDMIQQLAIVEPPVLDRFGVDTIEMGRGFLLQESDWKEWQLPDGTHCKIPAYVNVEKRGADWYLLDDDGRDLAVQKQGCLYFEQLYYPYLDRPIENEEFADLEDALGQHMWAVAHPGAHMDLDTSGLAELERGARQLRQSTDRAIIGLFGGNMFELPQMLYRMDIYLLYQMMYPDAVHRLLEALVNIHLKNLERWLGAVGPYIDIILFGDDLGGQTGPLISVDMYREFYKPHHRTLWQRAKALADVKVQLHCCGGIEPFLNDFIDAGLDAVNPVQISSSGMDTSRLKQTYGDRLTLWGGGCDTQDILPNATPDQVREHVRNQIDILAPHGGFVFQQVHNIMANVPPENVIAMFNAIIE